jgi:hypothetical protein
MKMNNSLRSTKDDLQTSPSAEVEYSDYEIKISDRFNHLFYLSSSRCAGTVPVLSFPVVTNLTSGSLRLHLSILLDLC